MHFLFWIVWQLLAVWCLCHQLHILDSHLNTLFYLIIWMTAISLVISLDHKLRLMVDRTRLIKLSLNHVPAHKLFRKLPCLPTKWHPVIHQTKVTVIQFNTFYNYPNAFSLKFKYWNEEFLMICILNLMTLSFIFIIYKPLYRLV